VRCHEHRRALALQALVAQRRPRRYGRAAEQPDVPKLLRSVLGLARRPDPAVELNEIPGWDCSATRRLVLAIKDAYRITVREEDLRAVKTVAALCDFLDLAMERSRTPAEPPGLPA
jgi:acyl carrier protein